MTTAEKEEYIARVMALEHCSRDRALILIEDSRAISERDKQRERVRKAQTPEKVKYRTNLRRSEKRCLCCGKYDEYTLYGSSRCKACMDRQRAYHKRHYEGRHKNG